MNDTNKVTFLNLKKILKKMRITNDEKYQPKDSIKNATTEQTGLVKPDGVTVKINEDGVISAECGSEEQSVANWTTNTAVGNLAKNTNLTGKTSLEILKMITVAYVVPSGSASFNNNVTYVENGNTLSGITATITSLVPGTNPISKVEFYNGSTMVNSQEYVSGTNTYKYTYDDISTSVTLKVRVYDTDGKYEDIASKSYSFVSASYEGVLDGEVNADSITGLNKLLRSKSNLTQAYTAAFQTVVYAYPASYGQLSSIINQNNYEVLGNFTKKTLDINGISYYAYYLENLNVSNFNYAFKY